MRLAVVMLMGLMAPAFGHSFIYHDRNGDAKTIEYRAEAFDDAGQEGSWNKGFQVWIKDAPIDGPVIVTCEPDQYSRPSVFTQYDFENQPPQETIVVPGREAPAMSQRFDYDLWHEVCR